MSNYTILSKYFLALSHNELNLMNECIIKQLEFAMQSFVVLEL